MKKQIFVLVALIGVILMSFGCDTGTGGTTGGTSTGGTSTGTATTGGGVCTENVTGIGRTAGAKLYYPCNISGGQIPASTMSSGWTAGLAAIEWLSRPMADQGNVVLAFTPANRYGMVTDWQAAHTNCFNRLKQMASSHAKLAGKINLSKMQIAGYSKGGGGSLAAAASLGSQVASVIGMAPYAGGEYNVNSLRNMSAATFIQCGGTGDSLARPAMTKQEFDALPSGISKLYKRRGAWSHLEWAYGANQGTIKNEIFAWMDWYLNGNKTSQNESILNNRTGVNAFQWDNK